MESGQWVRLHTVRDPFGAAFVGARLYPAASKKAHVRCEQVQETLRASFAQFGLPEEVQTDWEPVLNTPTRDDFPNLFTLWLAGLGIRHTHSRPGIPTDDAEVERGHRTLYDYALSGSLHFSLDELRQSLQTACQELNREYPSRAHGCQGQPPFQAHPELLHPPRPFDPQHELAAFDLSRADAFLATFTFDRKVNQTGQFSLGARGIRYSVGRPFAGQPIQIRFDPIDRSLVAYTQGIEIKRWKAKRLDADDILGFKKALPCPQQLPLPLHFQQVSINEHLEV